MYLRDLGKSLIRRWYFVIVGIGVTAGLSVFAANYLVPTYEARASLVLVPPATTIGKTGNPYLFLGGLQQSVDVLTRALDAESVRREVAVAAPTGEYKVEVDFASSAPIILVTANDSSSAGAQRLLDSTVRQAPVTLGDLQESIGVRAGALITTMVVSIDEKPKPVQTARYRTIALVTAASLFLAFMAIGLFDGLLLRRRGRKAAAAAGRADLEPDELAPGDADPSDPGSKRPSVHPSSRKRRGRRARLAASAAAAKPERSTLQPSEQDRG